MDIDPITQSIKIIEEDSDIPFTKAPAYSA